MKKLIPALAMLLVAACLMGTSTYAWFSANKQVSATGMKVKAASDGGLAIASWTDDGQGNIAAPEASAFASSATLKAGDWVRGTDPISPVSYNKGVTGSGKWFAAEADKAEDGAATKGWAEVSNAIDGYAHQTKWQIKSLQEELSQRLAELDKMKKKAENLRNQRQRDLDILRQEEKRSNDLVAQLNRNKTTYQRQLKTKQKQVEDLNREIEKIIAQHMAKSSGKGSAKKANKAIDYKLAAEFESNKAKLPWPADGPVVAKFGRQYHTVYTSLVMPFNNGINISLSKNDPVLAVFDGEVKSIIVMPGYNKCVLVQHGSYFTFYCKLGQVSVKTGDKIKTGQQLGLVDTIDGETQLHFQVWKEKDPQNPELWLRPR